MKVKAKPIKPSKLISEMRIVSARLRVHGFITQTEYQRIQKRIDKYEILALH